jgi:hypothetical protein
MATARAYFVMDFDTEAGRAALPTEDEHGFTIDGDGVVGHGYVLCSMATVGGAETCTVLVCANEDVIADMDDHDDFLFLEDA